MELKSETLLVVLMADKSVDGMDDLSSVVLKVASLVVVKVFGKEFEMVDHSVLITASYSVVDLEKNSVLDWADSWESKMEYVMVD
jgi:hypothetical protein